MVRSDYTEEEIEALWEKAHKGTYVKLDKEKLLKSISSE